LHFSYLSRSPNSILNPRKRKCVRKIWFHGLAVIILSCLFITITLKDNALIEFDAVGNPKLPLFINNTMLTAKQCECITDYLLRNAMFCPIASVLIFIFTWLIRRKHLYPDIVTRDDRPCKTIFFLILVFSIYESFV
jgi:hypothetical protein